MARPSIVVVGSSNTDLTVVADRLPGPGETVLGRKLVIAAGGKGANQAVAAARAGGEVAFIGKLGDDHFGRSTLDGLHREKIDTRYVGVDRDVASGVALIVVDETGENLIAVAPGANAHLSPADVRRGEELISRADLVLLQLEIALSTVRETIAAARESGVPVLLNPAPAPAESLPEDLLAGVDYLVPNEVEAAGLLGMAAGGEPEEMAQRLVEAGVGAVILTLGAEGACVCDRSRCFRVAAPPVRAIDTVGAGDCFCGALGVAVSSGMPLRQACQFAACAAALSVQRSGAQPSMPSRGEIDSFFDSLRRRGELWDDD